MASGDGLVVALLAAGRSTRFGAADKLTADLGGMPLMGWAARAGLAVEAQRYFIVAGPDAGDMPGYERRINAQPEQGMASSLRIAARAAEECGAAALLVLLADVPFVEVGHLQALVDAWRVDASRSIFSGAPGGVPQPPALFPARFFVTLHALEGDKGARGLASDALIIDAVAESLFDIDAPADLQRARHRLHST